ncbi:MAG: hypothetical protein Q4A79_01690 [Candidatus Saccharibacteria bacterium]|nr:hypothetical protein [Candidatus Saccharibacteria bacterium]
MKRKRSLMTLALLAVMGSSVYTPNSPALATSEETQAWSVEELASASTRLDALLEEECRGDYMCNEMYLMDLYDSGDEIFKALSIYDSERITITSINPSLGTMNIIYKSRDTLGRRMGMGGGEEDLRELYVVRFKNGYIDSDFITPLQQGIVVPTTYLVFGNTVDEGNVLPPNTEVTINLEGFGLSSEIKNDFWYYLSTTESSMMGNFNFSSCIDSPDYRDGLECRIMYNKSKPFYVPVVLDETLDDMLDDVQDPDLETENSPIEEPADQALEDNSVDDTPNENINNDDNLPDTSDGDIEDLDGPAYNGAEEDTSGEHENLANSESNTENSDIYNGENECLEPEDNDHSDPSLMDGDDASDDTDFSDSDTINNTNIIEGDKSSDNNHGENATSQDNTPHEEGGQYDYTNTTNNADSNRELNLSRIIASIRSAVDNGSRSYPTKKNSSSQVSNVATVSSNSSLDEASHDETVESSGLSDDLSEDSGDYEVSFIKNEDEVPTTKNREKEPYPWWLLIMIGIFGISLAIWWFFPIRRRRPRRGEE